MKIVLGQVAEVDGKLTMRRAIQLDGEELEKLPAKQIKGILYHAYLQLLQANLEAEVAELEKLHANS